MKVDTKRAYGYDPYLQHLLEFEHSQNYISKLYYTDIG
jgi:hypothetical protein